MKLSVIGVGRVGRAVGLSVIARGLVDRLVLVGRTPRSAAGDAADLRHASCCTRPAVVVSGGVPETAGSDVVVLTASAEHVAHDRRATAKPNGELYRQFIKPLAQASPKAVFIVVTNPVDPLTKLVQDESGLPHGQVLGSGTLLDTLRFRDLLAERCDVHPRDLRAYVLGEHGDSQVAAISAASVGGAPLGLPIEEVRELADKARMAGQLVAQEKGYTDFGAALATTMIVEAILHDSREVLPVSTRLTDYCGVSGVCLSVPAVVGRQGVIRTLPIRMNEEEAAAFRASAELMRGVEC
ncbi:MAG TPA: lactate dehydrogenase [Phycisphaerae bacterium]|nr:lactate dehydrogenase [Phycisphaerae bacterium]